LSRTKVDLSGKQFGKLTARKPSAKKRYWDCTCECGSQKSIRADHLNRAKNPTTSCGCENVIHGHTANGKRTPTYLTWAAMKTRCDDNKNQNYGAAGIRVCERWQDFSAFLADMGPRPAGKTLDRINVFGHYQPENCRWADAEQQAANKGKVEQVHYGETGYFASHPEWARYLTKRTGKPWTSKKLRAALELMTLEQIMCGTHEHRPSYDQLRWLSENDREMRLMTRVEAEMDAEDWIVSDEGPYSYRVVCSICKCMGWAYHYDKKIFEREVRAWEHRQRQSLGRSA
jgi:hypothetical protein